jgi:multicomponent Na+:H+ antiporter subunit E
VKQYPSEAPPSVGHYLFIFAVCLVLWLLLAGSLGPQELAAGALVALTVTLAAGPRLSILSGLRLSLTAPLHLVHYLGHFLVALIRANLDMARRVLSPSLPLRPAVVTVRTELRSALGKLLLANSITLTPGTLTVDVQDDRILVHWVDCPPGTDMEGNTRRIAESFERHISGFLK